MPHSLLLSHSEPQYIISRAYDLRLVSYLSVLSATLYIYDLLLTFSAEIEYIWFERWNTLKVLYLIQRYMPLVDTVILVLYSTFSSAPSERTCSILYQISGWMFMMGIAFSEVVLTLRALAVFGLTRSRAILTAMFFLACWTPNTYFLAKFMEAVTFDKAKPGVQCFASPGSSVLYLCWVFLMIYEAGILVLIGIPAVSAYKHEQLRMDTGLYSAVYRDGIIYYLLLFLLSLVNIVVILVLQPDLINLLSCLERVVHSNLTSRVILGIRAQGKWHINDPSHLEVRLSLVGDARLPTVQFVP